MNACPVHPDALLSEPCARCGDFACPKCALEYAGGQYCTRRCVEAAVIEREPAWEAGLYKFGTWRACAITVGSIVREPAAFYARTPEKATSSKPVGFYFFSVTILGWLGFALYFGLALALAPPRSSALVADDVFAGFMLAVYGPAFGLGAFALLLVATVIATAPFGGRGGFDGTARVLGYAWGSAVALALIPLAGPVIAAVVVPRAVYQGLRVVRGLGVVGALVGALVSAAIFPLVAAAAAFASHV